MGSNVAKRLLKPSRRGHDATHAHQEIRVFIKLLVDRLVVERRGRPSLLPLSDNFVLHIVSALSV